METVNGNKVAKTSSAAIQLVRQSVTVSEPHTSRENSVDNSDTGCIGSFPESIDSRACLPSSITLGFAISRGSNAA